MRLFLLLAILFQINTAMASTKKCTDGVCSGEISKLYLTTDGALYVQMNVDVSALSCTLLSGKYFVLSADSKNFDAMYASLFSKHNSSKEVLLKVSNSGICNIQYAVFDE
jgi:hypothetical protein